MDYVGTHTNEPKKEETDDYIQGLTSEKWYGQTIGIKKWSRRWFTDIKVYVDVSIKGHEEKIKKD